MPNVVICLNLFGQFEPVLWTYLYFCKMFMRVYLLLRNALKKRKIFEFALSQGKMWSSVPPSRWATEHKGLTVSPLPPFPKFSLLIYLQNVLFASQQSL